MMTTKQYEIYWVDLNPTRGSEMNKVRPCVIVSPDDMNNYLQTIIVAPVTSTERVRRNLGKIGKLILHDIREFDTLSL